MKLLLTILLFAAPVYAQQKLTISAYGSVLHTLRPKDLRGNPAKFTSGVAWSADKVGVITFRNCGSETCEFVWAKGPETVRVTVTAPGVTKTVTIDVTTLANMPVTFDVEPSPEIPDSAILQRSGTVMVAVNASDDTAVSEFRLEVDGAAIETVTSPPATFEVQWDTTRHSEGVHIVQGVAADAAGNVGRSEPVPVRVAQ